MANAKRLRETLLNRSKAAIESGRSAAPGVGDQSGAVWLPVSEVAPDPDQPRTHYDDDAMRQLCESIKAIGQIEPIVVQPLRPNERSDDPARRYRCLSGHRRLRAHAVLGLSEIKATVVRDELSPAERFAQEVASNEAREDHTDFDRARFMAVLFATALGLDEAIEDASARLDRVRYLVNRAFNELDRGGKFGAESKKTVAACEEALRSIGERRNLRWFHRWGLPLLALEGAPRDVAAEGLDARRTLAVAPLATRPSGDDLVRRVAALARERQIPHREFAASVRELVAAVDRAGARSVEAQSILSRLAGLGETDDGSPLKETRAATQPTSRAAGKGTSGGTHVLRERAESLSQRWALVGAAHGSRRGAASVLDLVDRFADSHPKRVARLLDRLDHADRELRELLDRDATPPKRRR